MNLVKLLLVVLGTSFGFSVFLLPISGMAAVGRGSLPHSPEQMQPAASHANGWSFVDVVRVGQNGFTRLDAGRAGPNDEVVVFGERNARVGLYLLANGAVTEVAAEGTVLSNGQGTLDNVAAGSYDYAILPSGDVIFKARATGGTLSPAFLYTFQWRDGSIALMQPSEEVDPDTLAQAFDHDLAQATTDNRWLASLRTGTFPNYTVNYGLTDGAARQSIFSFTNSAANCVFNTATQVAGNANGVAAYYEVLQTTPQDGARCANELGTTRTWSVKLAGGATGTVASGASFEQVNTYTGVELSGSSLILLNNQKQVAAIRQVFNSPATFVTRQQLVIFGASGEQIIHDTDGPASQIFLADFDAQGRVLYSVGLDDFVTTVLLDGPDLDGDRVIRTGDTLFGQTVGSLAWVRRPAAVTASGSGSFAFSYGLDDGSAGIALARRQPPRWINPAGGNWGTAGNWEPEAVPGAGDDVRFDRDARYVVNLGAQQAGSVALRAGDVTLRNGQLDISNPDGGTLSIDSSTPDKVARLTIEGTGDVNASTVVTAGSVTLGFGGPGELRIDNATLRPPENDDNPLDVTLGFAAPATVTVTGGSAWSWQQMAVGITQHSSLRVEDGSFVGFGADKLWIGGSSLGLPVRSATAQVIVDNANNKSGPLGVGTLLGLISELVVGNSLIGDLDVRDGGRVLAITTTVGTRDHGAVVDGLLTVQGTNATHPARFESGSSFGSGGLFLATGAGTNASVTVRGGGVMTLTQLSLADGAQSNAIMLVEGMEAADAGERRSTVIAPFPPETAEPETRQSLIGEVGNGDCVIGRAGRGTLTVSNGALVRCRQIAIGMLPGSRGELNVDGILRSVNARVVAEGVRIEDGVICIGRVPICGATSGAVAGDVRLGVDAILEGRLIGIGSGGRVRGSGLVIAADSVVVLPGGSIAPGIDQLEGTRDAGANTSPASTAQHAAGTLRIQGNLAISDTGVIRLNVLGATANLQDRLTVTGTMSLGGRLEVNFDNGYAPRNGDQLTLIAATAFTGAPDEVAITGLEDGFAYDLDVAGGKVMLTALNDGKASTQPAASGLFLPMVKR